MSQEERESGGGGEAKGLKEIKKKERYTKKMKAQRKEVKLEGEKREKKKTRMC